jgi:hypothetical protein
MYEVEEAEDEPEVAEQEADGLLRIDGRIALDAEAEAAGRSSPVSWCQPVFLSLSALRPPAVHLIISAPSSAQLAAPLPLSVTCLLSATAAVLEPTAAASLTLLASLSPSTSFLVVGPSTSAFTLSPSSPSHTVSFTLLPVAAGLLLLPSIRLYRPGKQSAEWEELEAEAVRRHFGLQERLQVLPVGRLRCELARVEHRA